MEDTKNGGAQIKAVSNCTVPLRVKQLQSLKSTKKKNVNNLLGEGAKSTPRGSKNGGRNSLTFLVILAHELGGVKI